MKAALVVLACLVLVPVAAARNFKVDLAVTPAPDVAVASTITGCGFAAGSSVRLFIEWYATDDPKSQEFSYTDQYTAADANGCIAYPWAPSQDGYWEIWALQGVHVMGKVVFDVD